MNGGGVSSGSNGDGDGGGGGGGGGCLALLCGGGTRHLTSVDGVDDVESDNASQLREDYEIGEILGRGTFGSVRACFLKPGRRNTVDMANPASTPTVTTATDAASADAAATADAKFNRAVKSVACDASKSSADRLREEVDTMLVVSGRHPNLPTVHAVYERMTPAGTSVQSPYIGKP